MLIQSYARGLSRGQKLNTMGAHHIRIDMGTHRRAKIGP